MGYHIWAKNRFGEDVSFFHYDNTDKDRPLHKVLKVNNPTSEIIKSYSKGDILQAKSDLLPVTNTLPEQDFLSRCLSAINETRNNILITFN